MNAPTLSKPRVLKVQDIGDRYYKKVKLQIRLAGKWLADAGMRPQTYVSVSNPQPGILVIRSLETQAITKGQSEKTALTCQGGRNGKPAC